jgi:hypothetical protein
MQGVLARMNPSQKREANLRFLRCPCQSKQKNSKKTPGKRDFIQKALFITQLGSE